MTAILVPSGDHDATPVDHNPTVTSSQGESLDALQTYATIDAGGNACLVVINVDPRTDITATIAPANYAYGTDATISTLASPNINDENNPSAPERVAIAQRSEAEASSCSSRDIR